MSIQGSCFMLTRDKYWDLNISDEYLGSWGSQAVECSSKIWLTGGRVLVNHNTWYAHLFRTQGGDFGFPYPNRQSKINEAKAKAKKLFLKDEWQHPKKTRSLLWLVEKFNPVKGWSETDVQRLKDGTI